jgi:hypothetical protein
VIDDAIANLAPVVGVRAACAAVGETQARYYRRHRRRPSAPRPARALTSRTAVALSPRIGRKLRILCEGY